MITYYIIFILKHHALYFIMHINQNIKLNICSGVFYENSRSFILFNFNAKNIHRFVKSLKQPNKQHVCVVLDIILLYLYSA